MTGANIISSLKGGGAEMDVYEDEDLRFDSWSEFTNRRPYLLLLVLLLVVLMLLLLAVPCRRRQ